MAAISADQVLPRRQQNDQNCPHFVTILFTAILGSVPSYADGAYKAWVCVDPNSNGNSAKFSQVNRIVNTLLRSGEYKNCTEVSANYVTSNTKSVLFDLDKIRILEHKTDISKLMFDTLGK